MANTYHKVYIQTVFAVKYRAALIQKNWKPQLLSVMGSLINEAGAKTLIVNGVEDHMHCFFSMPPSISISEIMKITKAKSSKWINENDLLPCRFEWQVGFGAFSYNKSAIHNVYRYIENQETHHQKKTFKVEYVALLKEHNVDYDERYIFHDPI
jgi:REP element-mobilizing transposase RayT